MSEKKYDIVIYGASSFVGQIIVNYFVDYCNSNLSAGESQLSWAIAGRSQSKLLQLKKSLGDKAAHIPIIIAQANDENALLSLCEQTKVVLSTVGPYALYGDTLIKACVESGTDYCDLTGEMQWIKRMMEQYADLAKKSGARIVHCCGFDSVPSDMGVFYLQQKSNELLGEPCSQVHLRVKSASGGFSGGTFASMLNANDEMAANPEIKKLLADSYAICPDGYPRQQDQRSILKAEYDYHIESWITPFMMAPINEPVVLRSNALTAYSYGKNFHYNEAIIVAPGVGGRIAAILIDKLIKVFTKATAIGILRPLIMRLMPSPGEGPSPEAQLKGFYDIRFYGKTNSGQRIAIKVTGDRDPGYGSTAKIISQAAISLAKDISKSEKQGGFWTSASIFDQRFIQRLRDKAGLTFEVVE